MVGSGVAFFCIIARAIPVANWLFCTVWLIFEHYTSDLSIALVCMQCELAIQTRQGEYGGSYRCILQCLEDFQFALDQPAKLEGLTLADFPVARRGHATEIGYETMEYIA